MTLPGKKELKTLFIILLWKISNAQKQREWSCECPVCSWPSSHSCEHFAILSHPWSFRLPPSIFFFLEFLKNSLSKPKTSYFTYYVKPLSETVFYHFLKTYIQYHITLNRISNGSLLLLDIQSILKSPRCLHNILFSRWLFQSGSSLGLHIIFGISTS